MTNDKLEAARTGNWFLETPLAIARLDKCARDETVQAKLAASECRWDLIVVDEAHKMSATFFGGEVKRAKRYRLGQLLSGITRHFLLLTAPPTHTQRQGRGRWARLPLPVARAVLFASVVDDPRPILRSFLRRRPKSASGSACLTSFA